MHKVQTIKGQAICCCNSKQDVDAVAPHHRSSCMQKPSKVSSSVVNEGEYWADSSSISDALVVIPDQKSAVFLGVAGGAAASRFAYGSVEVF